MSIDQRLTEDAQRTALVPALIECGLRRFLPDLARGRLCFLLPNGSCIATGNSESGPDITLEIKNWRPLWRLALGGEIAFAGSYIDGDWSTADLDQLFHLAMLNEQTLLQPTSPPWPMRALHRLRHFGNRNTLKGSRRNILAHYDLGNSFYQSWLDQGMNYSSALYRDSEASLEAAQVAKLDRVIELLAPTPGGRVLEIGCGWGGLAEQLVRVGSHVTAVTLSPAQLSYLRQRLSSAIATGDVDLALLDYRELTGRFDHVVSLEMIEAVGEAFWPTYFTALRERLRGGGTIVLQAITICETRFKSYRTRPDFIQHYIFPGGMLPTASLIREHAERAGLRLVAQEFFGDSYARTLSEWRRRFHRAWPSLAKGDFDERFHRLWDYYLAYCEMGFRFKATDVGFFKFEHGP
jgi:cyclopropane-fatty-acyl-phospholipid synthase